MPDHPPSFRLYRIAAVEPAHDCVDVQLAPAGVLPGAPLARRFCAAAAVTVLRDVAGVGGFASVEQRTDGREPACMPVTVSLTVRVGEIKGDDVKVWAMPRPSPIYVRRENAPLLQAIRQAQANGQAMVFANGTNMDATDAAPLSKPAAERLLGFAPGRP